MGYALTRFSLDPTEDTGSLYGDLMVIQREQVEMYNDRATRELLPLLIDALARDPQAATTFSEEFLQPRRQATVRVLDRAVERGEIPQSTTWNMRWTSSLARPSFVLRSPD